MNGQYVICSLCSTQPGYPESILLFSFLFFFIKLYQKMPSQALVVTLQRMALWETVCRVDWSYAYWGFPPNQYTFRNFLAYCRFCLCLHTAYYFWAKSVCTASIVHGLRNCSFWCDLDGRKVMTFLFFDFTNGMEVSQTYQ